MKSDYCGQAGVAQDVYWMELHFLRSHAEFGGGKYVQGGKPKLSPTNKHSNITMLQIAKGIARENDKTEGCVTARRSG